MLRVRNEDLSVTVEAYFLNPMIFDSGRVKAIALEALRHFGEFGLRPMHVKQRVGDELFDYELSFWLFNYQATFRFGAEHIFVNIGNVKGQNDLKLVVDCIARAAKCVDATLINNSRIQAASHSGFDSGEDFQFFLDRFVETKNGIIGGGRILLVQEIGWTAPIRLAVEKSLSAFKNSIFLAWSTESVGALDVETLKNAANVFDAAAQKIGLEVRFSE